MGGASKVKRAGLIDYRISGLGEEVGQEQKQRRAASYSAIYRYLVLASTRVSQRLVNINRERKRGTIALQRDSGSLL